MKAYDVTFLLNAKFVNFFLEKSHFYETKFTTSRTSGTAQALLFWKIFNFFDFFLEKSYF